MASGTQRTKEKDIRIAEIESAAREVFLTRGYQDATVQEIADRAGIAKGTVYIYYKGKEDLYAALMLSSQQYLVDRLSGMLEQMRNGGLSEGHLFLSALADIFLDLHYREPEMGLIYQAFQIGEIFKKELSEATFERATSAARTSFSLMREIIEEAAERELIRTVDVVKTVDALWGLYLGITQIEWNKLRWTKKDHLRDTLHYAFSLMFTGMCRERTPAHSS